MELQLLFLIAFSGNAQKSRQKEKNKPEPFGDEAKLLARLLRGYDKAARPVANASHTITVKVNFALTQILDMVRHTNNHHTFNMGR